MKYLKVPEDLAQSLINELVKAYPAIAVVARLQKCEAADDKPKNDRE